MSLGVTIEYKGYIPKGPSIRSGYFTGDAAYPGSGGYAVVPADLKFGLAIYKVIVQGASGYLAEFDHANSKLKLYNPTKHQAVAASSENKPIVTTGAATASAVDATQPHVDIPTGFRSEVDTGPGDECAQNLAGLNTVKFHFIAFGH